MREFSGEWNSPIHLRETQIYEAMKLPENHSIESSARDFLGGRSHDMELVWAALSEKQMSNKWPFSLLNDEQTSN